ncbi:helix-turn-helix transcriptional regulator [Streptomyces ziwulingensis]
MAGEFAARLRELKERSGLSYGTLAKRLHMSTSTLHRYCNGDAVPTDYAPVERLARLCKATPQELVELHRRWVLADATRGRKSAPGEPVSDGPAPEEPPDRRRTRTRTAVVVGIAVAAVVGAVVLAVHLPPGGSDDERRGAAGAAVEAETERDAASRSASPSPSRSASPSASSSVSPSAAPTRTEGSGEGQGGAARPSATAGAGGADDGASGVPLTVGVQPYDWESTCGMRYLVDRPSTEVKEPPLRQDAPAWVAAVGAVPSGEQYVTLTVQGTGERTVVVESLSVRVAGKRAPLAWNDYVMGYPGVGCGGGVPTRSFTVALDAARPGVVPQEGGADFPFKVSESDPEVYHITADASAYDVDWYLELKWSSGSRRGTLRVDDGGQPFRTSGNNGRPAYEFPLGGEKWVPEGTTVPS